MKQLEPELEGDSSGCQNLDMKYEIGQFLTCLYYISIQLSVSHKR